VLLLTITALLAAGCVAPTSGLQTPTREERERFSARRESEDGAIVACSGYTEGYKPGAEAEFDITIKNETDQTWLGRYCLQLLDRQWPKVIVTLEQRTFTLEPGVGFSDTITVRFPEGLSEGAYGLSLPVRRPGGSMVDLVPIQIGETDQVRRPTTQQDMDASLEACPPVEGANDGRITIEGVEVTAAQVVVRGKSTLPDGICVSTELWADGTLQTWWPADVCVPIRQGAWEFLVPLEAEQALQPGVQYMVCVYQPGGPNLVATFPFDLDGPPTPSSQASGDDPALLLPEAAEVLSQASADLDGCGVAELIFLTGFGGTPERLGYDFLKMFVITSVEPGELRPDGRADRWFAHRPVPHRHCRC